MNYTLLPQTYRDDVLAEALYAREVEYFHYAFDLRNFEHMLAAMPLCPARDDLAARLQQTREQMATVQAVHAALMAQITDPDAHAAAVARTTEKRNAA
jgi:hypothetical protein